VVYIDLNMVRAGVVGHPAEWSTGGYHEIRQGRSRYAIVDREALAEALGLGCVGELAEVHSGWIEGELRRGELKREPHWSESVAVGRHEFVERVQKELGGAGRYRDIEVHDSNAHVLREGSGTYRGYFAAEINGLSSEEG
jgi:hypothetical protein